MAEIRTLSLRRPAARGLLLAASLAIAASCADRPSMTLVHEPVPATELARIIRAEDLRDSSTIRDLSSSPNEAVAMRALFALGRIGDARDGDLLLAQLGAQRGRSVAAAFALGEAFDAATLAAQGARRRPDVAAALIARFDTAEEPRLRATVADALGKTSDTLAVAPLSKALGRLDGDLDPAEEHLAESVLMALARIKDPASPAVMARLAKSPSPRVRAALANALFRHGGSGGRATALDLLADPDALVRGNAVRLLGRTGTAADAPAVAALLADPDHNVRISAIRAWGALPIAATDRAGLPGTAAFLARFEQLAARALNTGAGEAGFGPRDTNELAVMIETLGDSHASDERLTPLFMLRARRDILGYRAQAAWPRVLVRSGIAITAADLPWWPAKEGELPSAEAFRHMLEAWPASDGKSMVFGAQLPIVRRIWESAPPEFQDLTGPALLEAEASQLVGSDEIGWQRVVIAGLRDSRPAVRTAAAGILSAQAAKQPPAELLFTPLVEMYLRERDVDARRAQLDALSAFLPTNPNARRFVERALRDPERVIRAEALRILNKDGIEGAAVAEALGPRPAGSAAAIRGAGTDEAAWYAELAARPAVLYAEIKVAGRGTMRVELNAAAAPIAVDNFVTLADRGYFNGRSFHRVVPNFVVQGGDPRNDMSGGPGYMIPCEINMLPFERGTLGMALSGKDTGGSQFFLCHAPQWHLDGGYTVFGRVVDPPPAGLRGVDMLDEIVQYDAIESVRVLPPEPRVEVRSALAGTSITQ